MPSAAPPVPPGESGLQSPALCLGARPPRDAPQRAARRRRPLQPRLDRLQHPRPIPDLRRHRPPAPRGQRPRGAPRGRLVQRGDRLERQTQPLRLSPPAAGPAACRTRRRRHPADLLRRCLEAGLQPHPGVQHLPRRDLRRPPGAARLGRPRLRRPQLEGGHRPSPDQRRPRRLGLAAGQEDAGAQAKCHDGADAGRLRVRPRTEPDRLGQAARPRPGRDDRHAALRGDAQPRRHPLHHQPAQSQMHRPLHTQGPGRRDLRTIFHLPRFPLRRAVRAPRQARA